MKEEERSQRGMFVEIINGPNLSNIGVREPDIYGIQTMDELLRDLRATHAEHRIDYWQSHCEGAIVERLHALDEMRADAVVLNAGAYTHTSIAILDAIRAIQIPVIEVHISNIYAREPYRHTSIIAPACRGVITGLGLDSYRLAVEWLLRTQGPHR